MTKCYMFNKPQGCITARCDTRHKTVMDYFPENIRQNYHPSGRLDKDTEGFLVITNDGSITQKLCEPEFNTPKEYFLWAIGEMNDKKIQQIKEGICIKNRETPCLGADIRVENEDFLYNISECFSDEHREKLLKNLNLPVFCAYITICEGKKHQVKRMMKAVGCTVVYLKRTKIGSLALDESLDVGEYREMTDYEMNLLFDKGQ